MKMTEPQDITVTAREKVKVKADELEHVPWAACDGAYVTGKWQPYDLALRTTRTGLLHNLYTPEDRRLGWRRG